MFGYSGFQWLFFFYMYCFFGWCFESTFVSLKSGKLVNRGFMRGPFLPLYGSGAIMMLVVSMPFRDNVLLTYVAGVIGATALEYVTGVVMEALFKVRYWDYSNRLLNFQGHICLRSSIVWGFFTILMTRVIHMPIEQMVLSIPARVMAWVTVLLTIYIVADFALSFKAALDLQDILVKIERAKEELERMQRRLDVIIAFNNEEKEFRRQERGERRELWMNEITAGLEQRFAAIKETLLRVPTAYGESVKEEIAELRGRFSEYLERQRSDSKILDFYKRNMIRNNPTMESRKYKNALEELKKIANNKR
ncbi:MAG: putative ABC transporter permease [Lachnospiraceae bacterium]|nr:putative ABC transporter permease [Lachnospiraceae bacterium]